MPYIFPNLIYNVVVDLVCAHKPDAASLAELTSK